MNLTTFLMCALATWRLTALWIEDTGPFGLFERARSGVVRFAHARRHWWLSKGMACWSCIGFWMALFVWHLRYTLTLEWLAIAGAMHLTRTMIDRRWPSPSIIPTLQTGCGECGSSATPQHIIHGAGTA